MNIQIFSITWRRADTVLSGLAAARQINKKFPKLAIVILLSEIDKHYIEEANNAGAKGYVVKSRADEALIRAVDAALVSDGQFVLVD